MYKVTNDSSELMTTVTNDSMELMTFIRLKKIFQTCCGIKYTII